MGEFEKESDYTREEEVELDEIYRTRNIFISIFLVLFFGVFLLGSFLISSSIESDENLTVSIVITSVLAFLLIVISISVFVHYQKLIIKAKRNDEIRHDEKVRFKERERLEHKRYDEMYNEIYEKVKKEFEEKNK